MNDETKDTKKLGIVPIEDILEEVSAVDIESDNIKEAEQSPEVKQLAHFRNIKVYLNKMVGRQWLLMYRDEETGHPVYVPNEYLSPEDQVFMAELAKNMVFQMMDFMGYDDVD